MTSGDRDVEIGGLGGDREDDSRRKESGPGKDRGRAVWLIEQERDRAASSRRPPASRLLRPALVPPRCKRLSALRFVDASRLAASKDQARVVGKRVEDGVGRGPVRTLTLGAVY